jgi:hypothetical protein
LFLGGGAKFGHDVAHQNTCTDSDEVGSTCHMNCPDTHPVHHFSHYWQEINCLPAGWWSQDLYTYYTGYCQAPSCNYFDVVSPENGWFSCSDEGYEGPEFNVSNNNLTGQNEFFFSDYSQNSKQIKK